MKITLTTIILFLGLEFMFVGAYLLPSSSTTFIKGKYQRLSTVRFMMQKPPKDSPYLQPEENKSPFHKKYAPDKSYPGTLAPGTAPENEPVDELPEENIIPYPHFQTWPYHYRLPPYRPYPLNFEESLTAQGKMVSEEEANRRSRLTTQHFGDENKNMNFDDSALAGLKGSLLTPGETQPVTSGSGLQEKKKRGPKSKKETSATSAASKQSLEGSESNEKNENTDRGDILDFNDFNQNDESSEEGDSDEEILDADEYLLEEALKLQLGNDKGNSKSDKDKDEDDSK